MFKVDGIFSLINRQLKKQGFRISETLLSVGRAVLGTALPLRCRYFLTILLTAVPLAVSMRSI